MSVTKLRLNIFGAGILAAAAIGLLSLVVIAVSLNTVGDSYHEISGDFVEGVGNGADSLDAAASALSIAALSVDTFDSGLGSTHDALDDASLAVRNSKEVSASIQDSFNELGASLETAADLMGIIQQFAGAADAIRSAGVSAQDSADLFAQYSPILDQADTDLKAIQDSLNESRAALPGIQREISNASGSLRQTSDSLDDAGDAIERLNQSSAIPRIAMFSLVFLGAIDLLLALGGFAALAAARKVEK